MGFIIVGLFVGAAIAGLAFALDVSNHVEYIRPRDLILFPSCIVIGGCIGGGLVNFLNIPAFFQFVLALALSSLVTILIALVGIRIIQQQPN